MYLSGVPWYLKSSVLRLAAFHWYIEVEAEMPNPRCANVVGGVSNLLILDEGRAGHHEIQ